MAKNEKKQKRRLGPAEKALNALLVLVVIAVLALAVWAVAPKMKSGYKNRQAEQAQEQSQTTGKSTTLADIAESYEVSADEFKAEFGLGEEVTEDTDLTEVFTEDYIKALPLGKYCKLMFAGLVNEDGTKITDDEAFEQLNEVYEFEETVTAQTVFSEVEEYMNKKSEELQAVQEAAAEAEASAENAEEASEESSVENSEEALNENE